MTAKPDLKPPLCSEHRIPMIWGETDFTYTENGVEVVVRHIPAWVCPHGDDTAFPPGITDELIATIRELIAVAKRTQTTRLSIPKQEYLVRVV
jgi:YgiT-type zinc finger domain-containing protein